ncbi:CHAT domain-containing protein [bacterium]|nr:CHAT domain-containing protein [bacterium]
MRFSLVFFSLLLTATAAFGELDLTEVQELWTSGARDSAFAMLGAKSIVARAEGDSTSLARLLLQEGSYLAAIGDHRQSEALLKEVENLALALSDSTVLVSAIRWMSVAVGSQGRAQDARDLYHRLNEIAMLLNDRRHEAWSHVGLAWDAWRRGDNESSALHYSTAADLFSDTVDVEGELWSRNGLATVQTSCGEYESALESYRASLRRAEEAGLPMAEAIALNGLGSLEYPLGRADRALQHFRKAAAIHAESGYRREEIPALLNIAMCLNSLGRTREAADTLEQALETCIKGGYADLEATVLVKQAESSAMIGRHRSAIEYYRRALDRGDALRQGMRINAFIGISESLKVQGLYHEALRELDSASTLLQDTALNWHGMRILGKRAQIRVLLGQNREALVLFLNLAEESDRAGIVEFRFHALSEAAGCCEALSMPDSAFTLYSLSARVWESDRRLLLDPDWRERRGSSGRRIFTDLAKLMIAQGERIEAFERLQAYKGRTLLERMLGPGNLYEQQLLETGDEPVELSKFQKAVLREDELFLDFYLGPEHLLLFAIHQQGMDVRQIEGGEKLEARLRAYRELISTAGSVDAQSLAKAGSHIFKTLFGEFGEILGEHRKILVSPDGVLNLIPFQEFPGAEDRIWTRVPSATILARIRSMEYETSGAARTLALSSSLGEMGEDLPGAIREVEELERLYGHVTRRRMDDPLQDLGEPDLFGYDILHIAAHARNDDQSPWQSAIVFRPDSQLRAVDIAKLRLDAGLAVLSSCSSAGTGFLSGEGTLGLSSAFLSAGVPAVFATLWPVDDLATAHFVEHFYDGLASGEACNVALSSAQEILKSQVETQHPYYWAGFVLIGEGEGRLPLDRRSSWLLPILGFSLMLILLFVGRRWRNKNV